MIVQRNQTIFNKGTVTFSSCAVSLGYTAVIWVSVWNTHDGSVCGRQYAITI